MGGTFPIPMASEFQGPTVKWEMRILLAFMKLKNWIFAFFFPGQDLTPEKAYQEQIQNLARQGQWRYKKENVQEKGGDEGKTVWNSHKENLHISEHYTKQCKFYEV